MWFCQAPLLNLRMKLLRSQLARGFELLTRLRCTDVEKALSFHNLQDNCKDVVLNHHDEEGSTYSPGTGRFRACEAG